MTKAFSEALARRPPRGTGVTDLGAANRVAVGAASSPVQALGQSPNGSGFFVTMVCTADAHVRFGLVGVLPAVSSDYLLRAGQAEEFWCESSEDTHFTVIQDAAVGLLYWYRSSR